MPKYVHHGISEEITTSGIFGLIDMTKFVMTLAVPGIAICMANRRCIAVDVKNPSISIKLKEFVFRAQYLANASNVLKWNFFR